MRTIFYLLREAWANISTNRTTTMVAVLTTAFTLACVGIFLLLYVNLRAAAGWLQDDIKIMLYLDDRAIAATVSDVEQQLPAAFVEFGAQRDRAAVRGELDGVRDEVVEDQLELRAVGM